MLGCAIIGLCTIVLSGCAIFNATSRNGILVKTQVKYGDAYEKAIKACRELDLPVNLANKDVGQVQCGLKSSEAKFFGTGYAIDVLLEKEQDVLKRIDVKATARAGAWGLPPSTSDAEGIIEKYLNALRSFGVE